MPDTPEPRLRPRPGPRRTSRPDISNWKKDTWYQLQVIKRDLDVEVDLVDPSDELTVASASFTLPTEVDNRVGVFATMGTRQTVDMYFDEFDVTPGR